MKLFEFLFNGPQAVARRYIAVETQNMCGEHVLCPSHLQTLNITYLPINKKAFSRLRQCFIVQQVAGSRDRYRKNGVASEILDILGDRALEVTGGSKPFQ